MSKTAAAKKAAPKSAAKEAPGAHTASTEKQGAPTTDQAAGVVTDPPASNSTEAGTESAPPASSDADAAVKLDSVLSGHPITSLDVIEGAGGVVTADDDSEIQGTMEKRVAGWVVECKRARGIWRAGRFWPPEPTAVPADELTDEQLTALLAEPLLLVFAVE